MKIKSKVLYFSIFILMGILFSALPAFGQSCGDVNNNGSVDIVDALLIAQYYVGLNPSPFYTNVSDTNADGSTDIIDALAIESGRP